MLRQIRFDSVARLVEIYLRLVGRHATFRIYLDDARKVANDSELRARLEAILSTGPTLLPFWNAHSVVLLTAQIALPAFRSFNSRLAAVADDSPGGRLTHHLYTRLGIPKQMLSVLSLEKRLADLRSIMKRKPNLVIAADSHGPYRKINIGMARLARCYSGNVRPIAGRANKSVRLFRQIRMVVPVPTSTVSIAIGPAPYLNSDAVGLPETASSLRVALANLEATLS